MITGATGFVGGAVARRALAEGDSVTAYVREPKRAAALVAAGAKLAVGSLGDPTALAKASAGAEVVVHAAAAASHRASERALQWTNVAGTENVLNAAQYAGCERVVVVSCGDVTLCNADRVNWNEDRHFIGEPIDAHARSKKLAEEVALGRLAAELEVTAVRPPAWIWGAGDQTSTLPELCHEGLGSHGVQLVASGSNLLSTIHIDNLVDAILSAAEVTAAVGLSYYVTDNVLITASEFFARLSEVVGLPAPRRGSAYAVMYARAALRRRMKGAGLHPTDVIHRGRGCHFDVAKAISDLDWEPQVSFADGMAGLGQWVQSVGGPEALGRRARQYGDDDRVEEMVALAGGD